MGALYCEPAKRGWEELQKESMGNCYCCKSPGDCELKHGDTVPSASSSKEKPGEGSHGADDANCSASLINKYGAPGNNKSWEKATPPRHSKSAGLQSSSNMGGTIFDRTSKDEVLSVGKELSDHHSKVNQRRRSETLSTSAGPSHTLGRGLDSKKDHDSLDIDPEVKVREHLLFVQSVLRGLVKKKHKKAKKLVKGPSGDRRGRSTHSTTSFRAGPKHKRRHRTEEVQTRQKPLFPWEEPKPQIPVVNEENEITPARQRHLDSENESTMEIMSLKDDYSQSSFNKHKRKARKITAVPSKSSQARHIGSTTSVEAETLEIGAPMRPPRVTPLNTSSSHLQAGEWSSSGQQWQPDKSSMATEDIVKRKGEALLLPIIRFDELTKIRDLDRGQSASVALYTWHGAEVAVKEMHGGGDESSVRTMLQEAEILAALRHPCVIAIYGMVTGGPATVVEYIVDGSLKTKLRSLREQGGISKRLRIAVALQVAYGMEFLHSRNIIHFDLKSANLLCDLRDLNRPIVKIGDMGLSKRKVETFVSGNMRGTLPWMAPELFPSIESGANVDMVIDRVNEKVDVYAFGIVLWEIWRMGTDPYPGLDTPELLYGIMSGNMRPEIPEECDESWVELMQKCWQQAPQDRPSFYDIACKLEADLQMCPLDCLQRDLTII